MTLAAWATSAIPTCFTIGGFPHGVPAAAQLIERKDDIIFPDILFGWR
jgi:hypothetical protein